MHKYQRNSIQLTVMMAIDEKNSRSFCFALTKTRIASQCACAESRPLLSAGLEQSPYNAGLIGNRSRVNDQSRIKIDVDHFRTGLVQTSPNLVLKVSTSSNYISKAERHEL